MADNHSVSSSKASSSSAKGRNVTSFFTQTFPVFPFLVNMELAVPTYLTTLGFVLQFLQMLAMVINPRANHGESLNGISQIVYAAQLPFWDPAFVSSTTFAKYQILFWIIVGIVLIWVVSVLAQLLGSNPSHRESFSSHVWRFTIHAATSILFVPLMQGLLSCMVCNAQGTLWTMNEQACGELVTIITRVAGIVAIILLFGLTIMSQTMLFSQDPLSWSMLSRGHVSLDVLTVCWKALSCIMFHILLSKPDKKHWMGMYMLFSSTIIAMATVTLLPYYHQRMNGLCTATALVIASTGLMTYLAAIDDVHGREANSFHEADIEGVLFFSLFCVVLRFGFRLADYRINPDLLQTLPSLIDMEAPPSPRNFLVFPSNLPVHDLADPQNRELVADIAEQTGADAFFDDFRDPLLTPFITNILCDTDVEVSTRFVNCADHLGGLINKKPVLLLASRIFTKGLSRFNDNGKILVALAHMISAFAEKQTLALMQAERIHRVEASIASRYHSFKLQLNLKVELNVRDANYQKMCDLAKKMHKETLIYMHQFWFKLCGQVDVAHLTTLATQITHRREQGNLMFQAALAYRSNDRSLLTKYAGFVDQILMDPEQAANLRAVTKNDAEERRKNAMRGARSGVVMQDQGITDAIATAATAFETSVNANKVSNRFSIYAAMILLIMIVGALIIFGFLANNSRKNTLSCVDHAGQARALSAKSLFLSLKYLASAVKNTSSNIGILNGIGAMADDFLAMHTYLTVGGEGETTALGSGFLHGQQVLNRKYISNVSAEIMQQDFWSTGFDIAQTLISIVPTVTYANNGSDGNNEFEMKSMEMLRITILGSNRWYSAALNASANVCIQSNSIVNKQYQVVLSILFTAFLIVASALTFFMSHSSSQVLQLKHSILSLFPMIPRLVLEHMAQSAKDRVATYDEQEDEEDVGKSARLHDEDQAQLVAATVTQDTSADEAHASDKQPLLPGNTQASPSEAKASTVDDEDDNTVASTVTGSVGLFFVGMIVLQLVVLVACAIGASMQTDAAEDWHRHWDRLALVYESQNDHRDAANSFSLYMQTKEDATFTEGFVSTRFMLLALTNMIAMRPSAAEVTLIKQVVTTLDKCSTKEKALALAFSLNTGALITDDTEQPYKPVGEATRNDFHRFTSDLRRLTDLLTKQYRTLVTSILSVASASAASSDLLGASAVQIVASALVLSCFIGGVFFYRFNHHFTGSRPRLVITLFSALCFVIVLALSVVTVTDISKLKTARNDFANYNEARRSITLNVDLLSQVARDFSQTGERAHYNEYFDQLSETTSVLHGSVRFPLKVAVSYFNSNATAAAEFKRLYDELVNLQLISIRLSVARFFIEPHLEVKNVVWNFTNESSAVNIRVEYEDEPFRYTTTASDLLGLPWKILQQARHTVYSARYKALSHKLASHILSFFSAMESSKYSDIVTLEDRIGAVTSACMAVAGLGTVCGVICIILIVVSYIGTSQQGGRQQGNHDDSVGRTDNVMYLRITLVALAITAAAVFAVGMAGEAMVRDNARNLNLGISREWHVARIMLSANEYYLNPAEVPLIRLRNELETSLADLLSARNNLYFTSIGYNIIGRDKALDDFMFAEKALLNADYKCAFIPSGGRPSAPVLRMGVSVAYIQFLQLVQDVIAATNDDKAKNAIDRLKLDVWGLLAGLRQSNYLLRAAMQRESDLFFVVFIALCVVLGIAVVVSATWVIFPLIAVLATEQAGSKLLLRLIPTSVRESVPAIQEFLETEGLGGSASGTGNDSTSDSSSFPVIAIDQRGFVLKFNNAAERIFGYTAAEVIGNNVSILMPERIAKSHDGYLSNYRRTGIRHVIGFDRKVHGKQKNGELFPIELNVKEFKRDNGEFLYFGFVKDISKNLDLKRTEELNNIVQEFATVPMIAIDSLGTVLRFNRAAEDCFGQPVSDVVNHNIKMLMPEDVAARHDSYLAGYLRTRQKRVIDSTRRLFGLRKSGETFPLELNVKEITTSDFGAMSTYLGFCRDLTQDLILDEANRINDEVADLSPFPIIGIDPYGKVLKFSLAAANFFGFEAIEVLDKNIKMLMPELIAEQHDQYLENYRMTGKKNIIGSDREITGKKKDGTFITFTAVIREVKSEGSAVGTFIGYLIDNSEYKKNTMFKAVDDIIVEMHATPLVCMSNNGTILRVNKSLLQEFGFRRDELIEKNIKLIMPPEVAAHHDGYLSRYAETKVQKVVGTTRRMYAKRKIGTVFPVEIKVDEVVDGDGKYTFIGFLRNLTDELKLESQFAINQATMEISLNAMIGMDAYGAVTSFSKAAEISWKRTRKSVIGKNVKMLMPDYIAVNHDTFLERYRTTKVKNIIDTKKVAEAIDADGKTFPIELMVKEIIDGKESHFVASVTDLSRIGEAKGTVSRNNQISDLSPLPLLQIDAYGVVLQFSVAAENEFQWKRSEVVGRNIKMLLPDEIAKNHDSYLAQYRKTRVKNVIGTFRRSRAKRKDGTTFAVELSITEVVVEGDGERNTYIGYIRDITEELRLIKSNEVSGVISDVSPSPLVAINSKGIIISFNRAACQAFGFVDAEMALNQNVKILQPDEVAAKHDGYLIAYAKTKQRHVINQATFVKAKRQDGTFFPAEISVREIVKDGKDPTFLSYIRDCTEEIDIAQATKVSEAIQTLSTIPMITIDRMGTIIGINRATPSLFGYDSEESLKGQNIKILMPLEVAVNHDRYLANYMRTGEKRFIDQITRVTAIRKDKTEFTAELSIKEINGEKQKDGIYIGYVTDITDRLKLEGLRRINDAIAEGSTVPLLVIDPVGTVLVFVPAAEEFFGYTADEVLHKNVMMLMPLAIANNHDAYLSNYLKTGVKTIINSSRVLQAMRKSGELIPARITVKEIASKDGETSNYIGYVEDMRSRFQVDVGLQMTAELRDMMSLAIISINDVGIVRQFNRAAEALFGYSKEEVIGMNVKLLMTQMIAVQHDRFLSNYATTKIRKVIGKETNVTGVTKKGDELGLELTVSEFEENGKSVYIAFCCDRTAELQLKQSGRISEALVSLSAVPIISISAKNLIQKFSTMAEVEFGYTAAEVMGQNIRILMTPEVAVNHDGYVNRYRTSGVARIIDKKVEVTAKRKNGTTFPAELTVKEIAKMGRDSSFVGYLRDITEDLKSRSNAILCHAIEALVPDPIIVINELGIIQTFTPPACMVFGYTKEEVLGQNIKMLQPPETAAQHDMYLKKYLTTGIKRVIDMTRNVTGKKKSGQLVEVELRVKEIAAGDMRYFIAYVRDCSRDFENTMETEVGHALAELNPDAIITIDPKGSVVKFNAQAEKMFEFDRRHIIGRNIKVLMPDQYASRHDQYLAAYAKSRVKRIINTSTQVTAEKKNGDVFPAEISVREVCNEAGEPIYYIGFIREVKK